MKKVYFVLTTGAIGIEVLTAKTFLYFIDHLRKNGVEPVAIFVAEPSNRTLDLLIKRKLNDIGCKYIDKSKNKLLSVLYHRVIRHKLFRFDCCNGVNIVNNVGNTKRYYDYVIHSGYKLVEVRGTLFDFEAMGDEKITLYFSDEENKIAQETLKKMGVNRGFVCVHARDSVFYPDREPFDNIRNISFESYISACHYLETSGIQTLRMGSKQLVTSREFFNQSIIDYAGVYRTDFMDIWTIAKCKFFLGCDSGLNMIPYMFNIPNAIANHQAILFDVPFSAHSIYIPQKLWLKKEKRFLTFKEIAEYDIGLDLWSRPRYDAEGIECIKSTPEEILDLAKEMNDVLDGKYQYTEEDNYLQQKFKSVFKVYHAPYHSPARVGREFLKQNKELFL